MYPELALFSYLLDRFFGEFGFIKSYKHPVIYIGEMIKWYEKNFYQDSKKSGFFLVVFVVGVVFCITYLIESYVQNILVLSILGSMSISHKMLKDEVLKVTKNPKNIKYLVSRDTKDLNQSDINKAAIETYAENLSDGVIAPLFYLLLFGIKGAFVYKAINTLDSMVGYKNERYKNFGFFSAKLDDVANFIPSRITAIMIGGDFFKIKEFAKGHKSPNAGYPISAMALKLKVKLGGDTIYFGKVVKKPYFGEGRENITKDDILKSVEYSKKIQIKIVLSLLLLNFMI